MSLKAGVYRPVALWETDTRQGVDFARAMGFNWVYLPGYRGLPAEEDRDRDHLRQAVRLCHEAGIQVCATLLVSSCAYVGSYRERSWYALDPWGHRISAPNPAGMNRAFVCWNAPEWLSEVQGQMRLLIDSGVDGIFFREPWIGEIPHEVGNGLLGSTGCHDPRCRSAYAEATGGAEIPKQVNADDTRSRKYLEWRAALVVRRLEEWIAFGREQKPDLHIVIEAVNPLHHHARVQYGIDMQRFGELADWVVIESRPAYLEVSGTLNQNIAALTAAAVPHTGVILRRDPALKGRALAANLAEAQSGQGAAVPCDPGLDDKAAARMNQWIEDNRDWLGQGKNCSPLGIYIPPMKADWTRSAPYVWAACQIVIRSGLPFRLVHDEDWSTLNTLIVPPGDIDGLDDRLAAWIGHVIALHQKRSGSVIWTAYHPPRQSWVHWAAVRWLTYPISGAIWHRVVSRRPIEPADAPRWMPPSHELLSELSTEFTPRVETEGQGAVLFVMRREVNGEEQWHFVNYANEPQRITVHAPEFVSGWVHSPQEAWRTRIFGHSLIMTIDDYKVVRLLKQKAGD